jgi:beta-lactamase superfamily II metal-dependent hydrolase
MAVRYVNSLDVYLLPARTNQNPATVSGAVQLLLGAWLDADLSTLDHGWVHCTDRKARTGWVRLNHLREEPLVKVFYIDVGQGDGTVIESRNGIVIVDGGPNVGLRDWLLDHYDPVIAADGHLKISSVVITHFDQDHFWGIKSLLENSQFRIERLFHNGLPRYAGSANLDLDLGTIHNTDQISTDLDDLNDASQLVNTGHLASRFRQFLEAALDAQQAGRLGRMERLYRRNLSTDPPTLPDFGDTDLRIEVLAPVPANATGPVRLPVFGDPHRSPGHQSRSHTLNGNSVVLLLTYGNRRFLFGGDLNQPAQDYLLGRYGPANPFRADVNKACHHGSADFELTYLDAVTPHATVFSSGDAGTYDHPMPDAMGAAARHSLGTCPLVFSTELAREVGSSGIHYGHINARCNGDILVMAQRKEIPTARKTWFTFPVPYPGPFGHP